MDFVHEGFVQRFTGLLQAITGSTSRVLGPFALSLDPKPTYPLHHQVTSKSAGFGVWCSGFRV